VEGGKEGCGMATALPVAPLRGRLPHGLPPCLLAKRLLWKDFLYSEASVLRAPG